MFGEICKQLERDMAQGLAIDLGVEEPGGVVGLTVAASKRWQ